MKTQLKKIGIIFIIMLVAVFCSISIATRQVRNHGHLSWRYYVANHRHQPVSMADIVYISPWMTFDYINKLFDLPPSYLEQAIHIEDSKYPLVTVSRYAKNANLNPVILIESIRNVVKQYVASSTPQ